MPTSRIWKYLTPAVLCFAIGLSSPLWYAARAAALGLIFAVGSLLYGVISVSADSDEIVQRAKEEPDPAKRARVKRAHLKPIRFALGALICALCILGPTAFRIVTRIGYS